MAFRDRLTIKPVDEAVGAFDGFPAHDLQALIARIAVKKAQDQPSDTLVLHMLHSCFEDSAWLSHYASTVVKRG